MKAKAPRPAPDRLFTDEQLQTMTKAQLKALPPDQQKRFEREFKEWEREQKKEGNTGPEPWEAELEELFPKGEKAEAAKPIVETPEKSKPTLKIFLWFIIIVFVIGGYVMYSHHDEEKKEKANQQELAKKNEIEQMISGLAEKNHAITNWEESLDRNILENIYTLDLLEALRVGSNEAVLIIADIEDLNKSTRGYLASFDYYLQRERFHLTIIAEITPNQLAELRRHREFLDHTFAIVLEATDIKRENKMEGIDSAGDMREREGFIVTGRCIEILHLPNYFIYKK